MFRRVLMLVPMSFEKSEHVLKRHEGVIKIVEEADREDWFDLSGVYNTYAFLEG
jgi:hypothetical protein